MNSNGNQTLDNDTNDDRTVEGIRGVLGRWVSACLTTYDKYYLGFGQGG